MYVYIYACMYICLYVCMYIYAYICMYVYIYVCMYICMYVCMYIHICILFGTLQTNLDTGRQTSTLAEPSAKACNSERHFSYSERHAAWVFIHPRRRC